ncbi:two-component sensor histidine kinase [Streptomyces armeniacus]|uniref:histidine kinase n=1 Tax=Streptomyces armeniacus TaxID=83291 RepID=A0A345XWP6_9ACTN|nr:histidine kinase [Streptomyces armeniacus]AXK36062.1 two-component sensor histidine kinase [Streptomyces armeniacus]
MFEAAAASLVRAVRPVVVRWRARGVLVHDAVFTAVLAPVVFAPGTAHIGAEFGDLPQRPLDAVGVLVMVALWVPLAVRRRWPGVCLAVVGSAYAAHELLGCPETFATVGLYVALYSAGSRIAGRPLVVAAASATGAYVLFAVGLHAKGSPQRLSDFVTIYVVLALCWGAGAWVRVRQAREAVRRRLGAAAAREQERARIARELHDVVTHHVTAMVVQADAAHVVLAEAPDRAAEGLTTIGDSGRRALDDLQHLLGVLDASGDGSGDASVPARLTDLVEETRAAGQPVELTELTELTERGERRPASGGVELAAYRVVQESLTNALKYAPGRKTAVRVRYGLEETDIEVTTDGPDAAVADGPEGQPGGPGGPAGPRGGGRGLDGLRERVSVLGGELLAGARPDGGFVVHARVPSGSD